MQVTLMRAWPGRHDAVEVEVAPGATVSDALAAGGWLPEAAGNGLAIFGRTASLDARLEAGDRVEVLRPLERDPKLSRRLREERAKARGTKAP